MSHPNPSRLTSYLRILVAVALAAGFALAPSGADAESVKEQRDRVRRERAQVASQLDTLRATDAQVEAALDALNGNVRAQQAAYDEAKRAKAEADARLAQAREDVAVKESQLSELQDALKELAIEAFIHPPSSDTFRALESVDLSEAEVRGALLDAQQSNEIDMLDQLERVREDLEAARARAEDAAAAADQAQSREGDELLALSKARDAQIVKAAEIDARIGHRLAEAASLANLDKDLSAKYEAQQQELARKLAAAAAAAAAAQQPTGNVSVPTVTGSGSIVSVRGIRVHRSIADNLARMLAAADSAGISLSGGGYRSPSAQIETRRRNCGSSNYAIYHAPASSCRPPTAKPGASMHERGLAIDFTYGGRIISSRSSPAYRWLANNAASYGFYNLPSEPWHWSTNGR